MLKLQSLLSEFTGSPISDKDIQAYREGRKPWKKLRDEIVPVAQFLAGRVPGDACVRFPLNDHPPDAWLRVGDGDPIGIEVTGALARAYRGRKGPV